MKEKINSGVFSRMGKSALAVLILFLCAALFCGAGSAVDVDDWTDLKTALSGSETMITITGDITTDVETNVVTISRTVTIDLNGHKISTESNGILFNVNGDNIVVTIIDSSESKTGLIEIGGSSNDKGKGIEVNHGKLVVGNGVTIHASYYGIQTRGSGNSNDAKYSVVEIQNGAVVKAIYALVVNRLDSTNYGYGTEVNVSGSLLGLTTSDNLYSGSSGTIGIFVSGNLGNGNRMTGENIPKIIINDGAVITGLTGSDSDTKKADAQAIAGNGQANVIINGGTFSGDEAIGIKDGNWIIKGGTFTATGEYHAPPTANGDGSEMTGATISVTSTYGRPVELTIRGGDFISENGYAIYDGKVGSSDSGLSKLTISGGEFTSNADKNVIVISDTPTGKDVSISGIKINAKGFTALKEGLEAGCDVILAENINYSPTTWDNIEINAGKQPTLDLNGKRITATKGGEVVFDLIRLAWKDTNPASLNVTDSIGGGKINVINTYYIFVIGGTGSTLVLDGGNYVADKAIIVGGTGTYNSTTNNNRNIDIIIKNNSKLSNREADVLIYMPCPNGKLTITENAELTSKASCIDVCSGTVTISENAKLKAEGNTNVIAQEPNGNGSVDEGSAIVIERKSGYGGNIVINIEDNAEISSTNGVAIRNYVRQQDLQHTSGQITETDDNAPVITIKDNAKLIGKDAVIVNQKYSNSAYAGDTQVGNFNINGGLYKCDNIVNIFKDVNPVYKSGTYTRMSTIADNGFYYPCIGEVSFDANGGSGTAQENMTFQKDVSQALTQNGFTAPNGKTFGGWATKADGAVVYADKQNITISGDLKLYAVWNTVVIPVPPVQTPQKDSTTGNTTIIPNSSSSQDNITVVGNKAVIDAGTVNITINYSNTPTQNSGGEVEGNISTINVDYNEMVLPTTADNPNPTKIDIVLSMDSNASAITTLPEITQGVNGTKADILKNEVPAIKIAAMIEGKSTINDNITEITLVFKVNKTWVDTNGGTSKLQLFHISDSGVISDPIKIISIVEDGTDYKITATSTHGFSAYALGVNTYTPPSPNPTSASVSSGGGSTDTGSGNYKIYERTTENGGKVSFGSSPIVSGVNLPEGSEGQVILSLETDVKAPENSVLVFDIKVHKVGDGTAEIFFKLSEKELNKLGVTASDICLYHYVNSEWIKLSTVYSVGTDGYVYYSAKTDSFSPFAIVKETGAAVNSGSEIVMPTETQTTAPVSTATVKPAEPTASPTKTQSPIGVMGILLGLAAVMVLRRK